jgi:hypothetical protein
LQDRLYTAYERAGEVMRATSRYVRDELQQPWIWFAARLAEYVFYHAWEQALGIMMVRQVTSPREDHIHGPWIQPSRAVLETRPGEPFAMAKQRLMAEALQFIRTLQPDERPELKTIKKGSLRKDQEKNAKQGTRWLYRQVIYQETPIELSRDYHAERAAHGSHRQTFSSGCGCVQHVSRGLKIAQTLLDHAPYRFS